MPELTFIEIAGLTVGISALNLTVIMTYIHNLHNQTKNKIEDVKECVNDKWTKGQAEHKRIWEKIDGKPIKSI